MPSFREAFHQIRTEIQPLYEASEATAIAREVLRHLTGLSYSQALTFPDQSLPEEQTAALEGIRSQLRNGRPLQYALGLAWFMGRPFRVNEQVLIPRPETEELVQWVLSDMAGNEEGVSILDIGTGSGCMAISLCLECPGARVSACDISFGALEVARGNALALGASPDWLLLDFLDSNLTTPLPQYKVLVSNPPYIPTARRDSLHPNVRDHEPPTALFVPDEDPLVFYRAIADFGLSHLLEGGAVYCELHADHAEASLELFQSYGYRKTELKKDLSGQPRMLKASYPLQAR